MHLLSILIALSASAPQPLASQGVTIDYVRGGTGPTARLHALRFNVAPVPGVELADAFDAIQRHPLCHQDDAHGRRGCRVELVCGDYVLTKPIELCRQMVIQGCGGGGWGSGTRLRVERSTGIHTNGVPYCKRRKFSGSTPSGEWTVIRDVALIDATQRQLQPLRAGVDMEGRAHLQDVFIEGFTHGVRIVADVLQKKTVKATRRAFGSRPVTNANMWRFYAVTVHWAHHAGVYVRRGDSNAGTSIGLDVTHACSRANELKSLGDCAGLVDASFLGNTYVGTHTASSKNKTQNYPGQDLRGPNNRAVVVGSYTEADQRPSLTDHRNQLVLGGHSTWDWNQDGFLFQGGRQTYLRTTTVNGTDLRAGRWIRGGEFGHFLVVEDPLRLPQGKRPLVPTLRFNLGERNDAFPPRLEILRDFEVRERIPLVPPG